MDRRLLLLLPVALERFPQRPLVEDLLATGAALAADPPRVSYDRTSRLPEVVGVTVAHKQAKRLLRRLRDDQPHAVAIFDAAQYPLARGLLALLPDAALWYEHTAAVPPGLSKLHALAAERAAVRFTPGDDLRAPLAELY